MHPAPYFHIFLRKMISCLFIPVLLDHGVIIHTCPMQQSTFLQTLSRLSILIIPVLFLLMIFSFKKKEKNSLDAMDRSFSKFLKSRVRRFERTPEDRNSLPPEPEQKLSSFNEQHGHSLHIRKPPVTFEDVAGINEVRVELE